MRMRSRKGELAVTPPVFNKVEARVTAGIATIQQRSECQVVGLVMDYTCDGTVYLAGQHQVILRGDAGLESWARQKLTASGREFVLCPEAKVIGFIEIPPEKASPAADNDGPFIVGC